jgi:hypothetical protein
MSRYVIAGGILCTIGLVILGFHAVSSIMIPGQIVWKSISILDVVDAEYVKWIDDISWTTFQKILKYIATMPLYALFLCVGGISFLIGGFVDR